MGTLGSILNLHGGVVERELPVLKQNILTIMEK